MNVQCAIDASQFVQFVYNNYLTSNPNGLNGLAVTDLAGAPAVEGRSYKVSRTIYANDLATDISPAPKPSEVCDWTVIGIVAVNDADPNDIYIAIRGTEKILEWIQDAKFFPIPFTRVPGAGFTEDGFTVMYESFSFQSGPSPIQFMADLIAGLPQDAKTAKVTITGHSLGGSLATLLAIDLAYHANFPLNVYTLASPRVGDMIFHQVFDHTVPNCYRVVNRLDAVPKLPPVPLYFHVGDEDELVPNDVRWSLLCEHSLSTYQHLLAAGTGQAARFHLDTPCAKPPAAAMAIGGHPPSAAVVPAMQAAATAEVVEVPMLAHSGD